MGVVLIGCFAVLVTELIKRTAGFARSAAADTGPPVETALTLAPGGRIASITAVGDRLVLHVVEPQRPDRLLFLDPRTAAVRAAVTVKSETP